LGSAEVEGRLNSNGQNIALAFFGKTNSVSGVRLLCHSLGAIKIGRLAALFFAALAAGFLTDWMRSDRVFFSPPLPPITTVPGP